LGYLRDVFTRLPTQLNSRIEELLHHGGGLSLKQAAPTGVACGGRQSNASSAKALSQCRTTLAKFG